MEQSAHPEETQLRVQQVQPRQEQQQEQTTGEEKQSSKVKRFIKESLRVLHITKKPGKEEYLSIVKVSGLGIGLLGALGFIIFLIDHLLFK